MAYQTYAEAWAKHQQLVQEAKYVEGQLGYAQAERNAAPPDSPDLAALDAAVAQRQAELIDARTAVSALELEQARVDPNHAAALEQGLPPDDKEIWAADARLKAEAFAAEQRVHEELTKSRTFEADAQAKLEADQKVEAAREELAAARTAVAEFQWAQAPEVRDALEGNMPAPMTAGEKAREVTVSLATSDPAIEQVIDTGLDLTAIAMGAKGFGEGALQGAPTAELVKHVIEQAPNMVDYTMGALHTAINEYPTPAPDTIDRSRPPPVTVEQEHTIALQAMEAKHAAEREAKEAQLQKAKDAQEQRINDGDVKDPDKARAQSEAVAKDILEKLEQKQAQERADEIARQQADLARDAADRAADAARIAAQRQREADLFR